MDAPPRRKFRAPKKVQPAVFNGGEEVLAAFFGSHQEIRSVIQDCAGMDLNRFFWFRSPFVLWLSMTIGDGLLLMAAHERRHLWQAKHVCSLIENTSSPDS